MVDLLLANFDKVYLRKALNDREVLLFVIHKIDPAFKCPPWILTKIIKQLNWRLK